MFILTVLAKGEKKLHNVTFSELKMKNGKVVLTNGGSIELNKEQQAVLRKLNIEVVAFNNSEMAIFYSEFQALRQLHISYQDYSIFYVAKKHNGELLSNDKTLRNFASAKQVKVKGIFYILDKMIELGIESSVNMLMCLKKLAEINNRLPINEIEKRIESYSLA